ncbi:uncharacterized protein C8A04DRAFT_32722 [Dichotomopilus funicola]|uniref:Uncharacterized protein n=1 Tax=Dichotomopilus funicola TaxID=1934379 RepID=A0AAN6UV40_9PEZI|nr:hypothetical protein C8A04DRAFT_32722 [Dichotomopilus funicola]
MTTGEDGNESYLEGSQIDEARKAYHKASELADDATEEYRRMERLIPRRGRQLSGPNAAYGDGKGSRQRNVNYTAAEQREMCGHAKKAFHYRKAEFKLRRVASKKYGTVVIKRHKQTGFDSPAGHWKQVDGKRENAGSWWDAAYEHREMAIYLGCQEGEISPVPSWGSSDSSPESPERELPDQSLG